MFYAAAGSLFLQLAGETSAIGMILKAESRFAVHGFFFGINQPVRGTYCCTSGGIR